MSEVITIDGPAASGKSSVSRELAKKLGWSWVSTGSFYRGLAYVAEQLSYDFDNESALADLALKRDIWEIQLDIDKTKVIYKGQDVTSQAHRESMGTLASRVSQYPEVRQNLLKAQRDCANQPNGLIAEGRDCGSVVFPEARVKIYLTANQEDRASRRAMEMGKNAADIEKAQKERDARDKERKVAPLQIPENAHVIDTSKLNLEQVVEKVSLLVEKHLNT